MHLASAAGTSFLATEQKRSRQQIEVADSIEQQQVSAAHMKSAKREAPTVTMFVLCRVEFDQYEHVTAFKIANLNTEEHISGKRVSCFSLLFLSLVCVTHSSLLFFLCCLLCRATWSLA
jgi:hypothetical protein